MRLRSSSCPDCRRLKTSENFAAPDGGGLGALAKEMFGRCQEVIDLKGERIPKLHPIASGGATLYSLQHDAVLEANVRHLHAVCLGANELHIMCVSGSKSVWQE